MLFSREKGAMTFPARSRTSARRLPPGLSTLTNSRRLGSDRVGQAVLLLADAAR
jgi:hypothetical protein